MPAPIVSKNEVLLRLLRVFRRLGYEGSSLSEISKETGLGKASLYHYFPKGKRQMAQAVLNEVAEWTDRNILHLLSDEKIVPETKIKVMLERVSSFYGHGKEACIIEALLHGDAATKFQGSIRKNLQKWADALIEVLVERGLQKSKAERNVEDMFVRIQGSLIVSKAFRSNDIFKRTLLELSEHLLSK